MSHNIQFFHLVSLLAFSMICASSAGCNTAGLTRAQSPDDKSPPKHSLRTEATEGESLAQERESLARQELELERQKAELELIKLQHQIELERQRNEAQLDSERKKRQEFERGESIREQEATAAQFSSGEFGEMKELFVSSGNEFGESLLGATHPTGQYGYTDTPIVALSADRDTVTCRITVHWKGGLSEHDYTTTYSVGLTKNGLDRLEVLRDTAIIKIDPVLLKSAETQLREVFDRN